MKQIILKIKQNGEIEAETKGLKGKSCLKYVIEIERLTNAVTKDSCFTEEYYENESIITNDNITEVTA